MREADRQSRSRRWRRWALLAGFVLLVAPAGGAGWLYLQLRGGLPQLDGQIALPGLSALVIIERDGLGIPTIQGATRSDVARATGFIHAQERFFQMDLLRRVAAGELAELFGAAALDLDRRSRLHRFRERAQEVLTTASVEEQALLATYTAGVNAGLAALAAVPFEYQLIRLQPAPWRPEDTLLVVYAMYLDLQGSQWRRESVRGALHDRLPPALAEFLDPLGTEWDAPLQGEPFAAAPPPGPEVFDLRRDSFPRPAVEAAPAARTASSTPPTLAALLAPWLQDGAVEGADFSSGSNNWAISGRLTAHGGALLANDMHLKLRVPNVWYRATLIYPDADGRERRVSGVMLPGAPAMVVGSNGHLAWGFTNSEGDWADLVVLEPGPDETAYQTPAGPRPFTRIQETLAVKDGPDEKLEILETIWGPVLDRDHQGRRRALRWVAHDPRAMNLELLALEELDSLEAALDAANRVGMPAQNFLLASADGRIAWTLVGPIPRRFGHDGRLPASWADGRRGWNGWLDPAEYPRIVDPPSGLLWTANNRVMDSAWLDLLGDGGYALGARARQIRDGLQGMESFDEATSLGLQLDDRALFLERWRALLLATLTPDVIAADPRRAELLPWVEDWGGRAAADSVGYRLVRTFRLEARARALEPLLAVALPGEPYFDYDGLRQHEGPLWQLVTQQPPHLLDPWYADWSALLRDAVDATLAAATAEGRPLAAWTWGEYNRSRIQHPFSTILPWLSDWLDLPPHPLPGDRYMPRIQGPGDGASQRLAVMPGREENGILHLPGGQSGHPLSPYYQAGHDAWVQGEPSPLLPGPVRHRLILSPESTPY
jgi:penicillin G amidase